MPVLVRQAFESQNVCDFRAHTEIQYSPLSSSLNKLNAKIAYRKELCPDDRHPKSRSIRTFSERSENICCHHLDGRLEMLINEN